MNEKLKKGFKNYLKLEKSLSLNSIDAYLTDIDKLFQFTECLRPTKNITELELEHLQKFVHWIADLGMNARSQARIISGIKAFYKYLKLDEEISINPSVLLEAPKIGRKLPDTLSLTEIDKIIAAIDLSKAEGQRNKAIIETLYSCGLRVSELTELKITNLFF